MICVDANLVVRLYVGQGNPDVLRLWKEWRSTRAHLLAPVLLRYEVTNTLYQYVRHGELTAEAARRALTSALSLPIELESDPAVHRQALDLASRLSLPATYDSHYLAVALRHHAEFWTADRKLVHSVYDKFTWVHLVETAPGL